MFKTARMALLAVLFAGSAGPLFAADLSEPQVEEAPPPVVEQQPIDVGGWYIRGDIDYHKSSLRSIDYITYGPPPGSNDFD
ncbi:MAG: porin family protein, partial [Mesorhizobium sp.]